MEQFDLDRFLRAQEPVMPQVLRELQDGRKRSHWMWFVFPQLRGLGRSETARHYGLASLAEARAYWAHPILGPRLRDCTALVNEAVGAEIRDILGTPDDLKFRSCATLFHRVAPEEAVFPAALARFFGGAEDAATLALLGEDG